MTAMTIIGRWQQEAAGLGRQPFQPKSIGRASGARDFGVFMRGAISTSSVRPMVRVGIGVPTLCRPAAYLAGGPDSIPVRGSARHTPRWPSQRPPSPTNTIRRTGRLLTPSTLVSSSTLPARPPQPSWRMRAMMSRMRMAPRFSVPR